MNSSPFFYSNEQALSVAFNNEQDVQFTERKESAIQVTSNNLNSTIRFPQGHQIHYAVIAINPAYLKALFRLNEINSTIETITTVGKNFFFFENMNAETRLLRSANAVVFIASKLSKKLNGWIECRCRYMV